MRKLIVFIALGIVMLSSCNNGQTKGVSEEIDSIALRAKTDTVLSFNGVVLGNTSIEEYSEAAPDTVATFDKDAIISVDKWTYNAKYRFDGDVVKSVRKNHKVVNTVKIGSISICIGDWQYDKIDSTDIRRIVKLYTSRYGKYSYYDANDGNSPIYFSNDKVDSLSCNSYLNTFIYKGKGKIVWEWANCSITIETGLDCCFITYSSSGAKDRLKEEKEIESKAKQQDI